jgi:hypothetical protein
MSVYLALTFYLLHGYVTGGGWTKIYDNDFTSNHDGIDFNIAVRQHLHPLLASVSYSMCCGCLHVQNTYVYHTVHGYNFSPDTLFALRCYHCAV